jgi:hypothetical protein
MLPGSGLETKALNSVPACPMKDGMFVLHQDRLSSMNKQNHLFEIAENGQEVSECLV